MTSPTARAIINALLVAKTGDARDRVVRELKRAYPVGFVEQCVGTVEQLESAAFVRRQSAEIERTAKRTSRRGTAQRARMRGHP